MADDPSDRLKKLSPAKRALLIKALQSESASAEQAKTVLRRERPNALPLSFAQERLWFLDQLEPGSPAYNRPAAMALTGALAWPALVRSLNEIVRRHESLRTTFALVDGRPVQVIAPAVNVALPLIDLSMLPSAEREARAVRLMSEEAQRPFDLAHDVLLRATVLRLQPDRHVLILIVHHIVSDAWSMGVFIREMLALYTAFVAGQPPALAALPVQYADYALWQRERLQGDELQRQLAYWRQQLGGELPTLHLPVDRPRPVNQTFRGASLDRMLPLDLNQTLSAFNRQHGVTLFMTLLSAFATLLYRYTSQIDVLLGTPIANRTRAELEPLIGLFVNTLVLRIQPSGTLTFHELLQQVRQTALAAYAHQEVPFEKLVEALQPQRDLSRNPLFQVLFVLQNAPLPELNAPGLNLRPLELHTETAKFDLALAVEETPAGLRLTAEYNTDLFEPETIQRLLEHYQILLEGLLAQPEERLWVAPLLSASERRQLLDEWNATGADYPLDIPLHRWIETQVERSPDAVAVVYEDHALTYRELNRRANQLAHHLQALGVGPEVIVGVCLERSLELVVALLGVLKAGGAYLPLDPDYPPARLAFMLTDAQTPVLLTQSHLLARLPEHTAYTLCLDADWLTVVQHPASNLQLLSSPNNPAYVIYTSGSTGLPKGVVNVHRAIANRLAWMQAAYRLTEMDRVLQKTPFGFDVSVWEFFWPLMTGATLVVARPGGHRESDYLIEVIGQQAISTLHFVPSMLAQFLTEPRAGLCRSIKRIICSGEALSYDLQVRCFERLPWVELHNLYGPTEAAVDVSAWACERAGERHTVPIGRPIANVQLYVLNNDLQPLPVGAVGELHIGGVGLARGYLNRPDLTAEKFIPFPPLSWTGGDEGGGGRLYKTGDLARYRADGAIEYLGRLDDQVKVRGHRIELGEIEAVLAEHPLVSACVVAIRSGKTGDRRLIAYVVPIDGATPRGDALRDHLRARLPEYMLPAEFVVIESLPLTPNGKVDRRALSAITGQSLQPKAAYVAPRTSLEHTIAEVWQAVLRVERVGIHDDFFALGGHSLLITEVLTRLNQAAHVQVPIRSVFQHPTVAGLAEWVEQTRQGAENAQPIRERLANAFPTDRLQLLEAYLREEIARIVGGVAAPDFGSIANELFWSLRRDLQLPIYPHELGRVTSIEVLARLVDVELKRLPGLSAEAFTPSSPSIELAILPARDVQRTSAPAQKNRPAVFLLSSPRSGSTLLRVMLAGHPALFCPPEIGLLFFESMGEWRGYLNDPAHQGFQWAAEGLQWAYMEALGLGAEESKARLQDLAERDTSIQTVYALLQHHTGERLLVDKAPRYTLSRETLAKAEALFDRPKYIHLVRHPYAVIDSFVRNRIDKLYGIDAGDPYAIAEQVWVTGNRNVLDLARAVGADRYHRVHYEQLVGEPARVMRLVCEFLGLPFDEAVLQPYAGRRMIGGVGDQNILRHDRIDPSLGDVWQHIRLPRPLGPAARDLALELEYELPVETAALPAALTPSQARQWLTQLDRLSDSEVHALLGDLLTGKEAEE